jgi:hypothetical protein
MTREHFIEALEEELRRQHVQFRQAEVMAFVAAHWGSIVKNPDVVHWAREFIDSGRGIVSV